MTHTKNSPAYPPQIVLDQFQRAVAPIPGLTKLEAVAMHVLPFYLEVSKQVQITKNGVKITPIAAAFETAAEFCDYIDKQTEKLNVIHE